MNENNKQQENNIKEESNIKNLFYNNDNFIDRIQNIQLSLLSQEEIESMSFGEVKSAETINYKTHIPVKDGLFCQKIFGPLKDWTCGCGKYSGIIFKNIVCNECKVKVDSSNVRRERIGHIKLSVPILHSCYYLGNYNNYLSTILDCENRNISEIVYYEKFIFPSTNFINDFSLEIINRNRLDSLNDEEKQRILYGNEGIETILSSIDLRKMIDYLSKNPSKKDQKRISFIKHMIEENTDIKRIIIKSLPVLPCDLRPIIPLNNGVLGTVDINHLYRTVILRNNRIKVLTELNVPEIILRHSKILLQKSVDALFDNSRLKKSVKSKGRSLKSISDELSGKQGILRSNLLGKRVDFSARSVIVIDPKLKITECALPIEMAAELFKLEICRKLLQDNKLVTLKEAKEEVDRLTPKVIQILREIIKNRSILLNRAPTLHRNSLQSFNIKLTEGKAIKIHPLICEGFNADCDGDLMAIYLSLLPSTILENKILMDVSNNIFSFANGNTIVRPIREILMGCYYATIDLGKEPKRGIIKNVKDVIKLYENNLLDIHEKIQVVINKKLVKTTTGRVLINQFLPEKFRIYNVIFDKDLIEKISFEISDELGNEVISEILDSLKEFGFSYSTKYGLTLSLEDMILPKSKEKKVNQTTKKSLEINDLKENKILSHEEARNYNIGNWSETIEELKDEIKKDSQNNPLNDLFISINSGARGSMEQPRQLSIMRGLVADATDKIIDFPVVSSYKDGLSPIEYFISSSGARKGASDRALKTASAGYITRKLVVLNSGSFISEYDCGTKKGIYFDDISSKENQKNIVDKYERIFGRSLCEDTLDLKRNKILDKNDIQKLKSNNIFPKTRNVLTCESENICSLCYGLDLARRCVIAIGTPVGIIAAQSIGEPALQLTMRTFHTGGATLTETYNKVSTNKDSVLISISSNIHDISTSNESYYKYITKNTGEIKLRTSDNKEKTIIVDSGDLLHYKVGDRIPKNSTIVTKNLNSEIFFSEYTGKVKILSNISKINDETILTSSNPKVSIDGNEISIAKNSVIFYNDGDYIKEGDILAKRVHISNVSKDIIDSLKQIEHILETRKVKETSLQSTHNGVFNYDLIDETNIQPYILTDNNEKKPLKNCKLESLIVNKGDYVKEGQQITFGMIDYNKIINVLGTKKSMIFILNAIKEKYQERGIKIDDKHIEIVVKRMFSFGIVTESETFKFNIGNLYPIESIQEYNKTAEKKVKYSVQCMSITKACLNSKSFISATSFQNTKNLLAEAAFFNKKDQLLGIEENMLVGNPIPVGTGMKNNIDKIYNKITEEDINSSLSIFLKKVNPFYFVNTCLDVLQEKNKNDSKFVENNNNWVDIIIKETRAKIIKNKK